MSQPHPENKSASERTKPLDGVDKVELAIKEEQKTVKDTQAQLPQFKNKKQELLISSQSASKQDSSANSSAAS